VQTTRAKSGKRQNGVQGADVGLCAKSSPIVAFLDFSNAPLGRHKKHGFKLDQCTRKNVVMLQNTVSFLWCHLVPSQFVAPFYPQPVQDVAIFKTNSYPVQY